MPASKKLLALVSACAYANALDFNVEPTCVPDTDVDDSHLEMILPFLCKFEETADYDPGFDCTDIPEECTDDIRKKALWASTKRYVATGVCRHGSHLSREIEHPECLFGEAVPELRFADMMTPAWNARNFAENVLSSNPTACAAYKALQAYDIFGEISRKRLSEIARHGRVRDYDMMLRKLVNEVDVLKNDCKEPWEPEEADDTINRLEAKDWEFSRKVFDAEKCTVLRRYNGSSFAKPHHGSFDGCKAECESEPTCNAFNMDLRFTTTIKQAQCDLLNCPSGVSKSEKFGYVGFARINVPSDGDEITVHD